MFSANLPTKSTWKLWVEGDHDFDDPNDYYKYSGLRINPALVAECAYEAYCNEHYPSEYFEGETTVKLEDSDGATFLFNISIYLEPVYTSGPVHLEEDDVD